MSKKVFVGNLPWKIDTNGLISVLDGLGIPFRSVNVVTNQDTGQSRGFGFIEVPDDDTGEVIEALNGYRLEGRVLNASMARERSRMSPDLSKEFFPSQEQFPSIRRDR